MGRASFVYMNRMNKSKGLSKRKNSPRKNTDTAHWFLQEMHWINKLARFAPRKRMWPPRIVFGRLCSQWLGSISRVNQKASAMALGNSVNYPSLFSITHNYALSTIIIHCHSWFFHYYLSWFCTAQSCGDRRFRPGGGPFLAYVTFLRGLVNWSTSWGTFHMVTVGDSMGVSSNAYWIGFEWWN